MTTYTNIPTFTSGQVLTSAVMNDVKDNLDLTNAQSAYPYRNLIYNGAMQVAQRGTSTAGISNAYAYYTADRWVVYAGTLGTWTQSIENDAPTGSGLRKSLKMLCTTADASPAAGDLLRIQQSLEGYDVQRLAKGTSSAQELTLSFWVKANVTGTYIAELYDEDNTRSVSKSYTISASATWERKEISFPADTTGALDNDNAASLTLIFHLAEGSTYTSGTLATTWGAVTNANRAVGQTNLAAATNNYWQITGVQFEAGSVATPFEFLPFGDELARCQRYYYRHVDNTGSAYTPVCNFVYYSATNAEGVVHFPVRMRTGPAIDVSSGTDYFAFSRVGTIDYLDTLGIGVTSVTCCTINNTTNVSGTAGNAGVLFTNNNAGAKHVSFSAEL